jgi:hypothetical protein
MFEKMMSRIREELLKSIKKKDTQGTIAANSCLSYLID